MKILVNGQIKDLVLIDTKSGCEWTQDLIGNADGYDDDQELYMMTAATYDWWLNYINTEQDLQDRMQLITANLDDAASDRFEQSLVDAGD